MTLSYYVADPEIRRRAWLMRRDLQAGDGAAQRRPPALADLERQGRLLALITQNIDGLHQRPGPPAKVLELHGTVQVECLTCGDRTTMRSALARVDAGEPDPACLLCGGILKSATISLRPGARQRRAATPRRRRPRTATSSSPSARRCRCGRRPGSVRSPSTHGARLVIVNAEPTPYDDLADVVVREPIGTRCRGCCAPVTPGG